MKRLHITLTDEVADRLKSESIRVNKSRSAIIEEVVTSWLSGSDRGSDRGSDSGSNRGLNQPTDVETLTLRVKDLEMSLRWLEGEFSRVNSVLIQRALPKETFWSRVRAWWHTNERR